MRAPIDRLDVQRAKARSMMPGVANRPMGINPMAVKAPMAVRGPRALMSRPAPMMAPSPDGAPPGGIMSQQPPMMNKGGSARTKMGSKKVVALKKGGRYEGSKEDMAEDKKMAKKRNMSLKDWEKSSEDAAMDAKEAGQENYKRGGSTKMVGRGKIARKASGGVMGMASGDQDGMASGDQDGLAEDMDGVGSLSSMRAPYRVDPDSGYDTTVGPNESSTSMPRGASGRKKVTMPLPPHPTSRVPKGKSPDTIDLKRGGGMKKAARGKMGRYAAGGAAKIRKGVMTKDGAPIKTKARVNG